MDRLVKPDVKEVELSFKKGQKCSTTFRLSNLMHTMSVAVSLTTTNPSLFYFPKPFSIIPPLSSLSYTLVLSKPSDEPPLASPFDIITVRSSMLPTGKAHQDNLRRLFSRPGPHVFRDAIIPIFFVGPQVVDFLINNHTHISDSKHFLLKSIYGCSCSELTALLKPAVESGNADLISRLIDAGANVNHRNSNGGSLLSAAVHVGHIDIVKVLIASGCHIDNSVDKVLHQAATRNRVDLFEILYKNFTEIEINSINSEGQTPIHIAASHGHIEVLKFCISIGGSAEILDCNGWTPLHFAAAEGHLEAVKCLLDSSNTKYCVNKDGKTAFTLAFDKGHSHLLGLLQLDDALHRAATVDNVNGLKRFLTEGAVVNEKDQNGWTPLHRAAFKGRIECVKVLLNHGAQVNVVDDVGYTPLHCAVETGHVQVALLLIAHGARTNVKGVKGTMTFGEQNTLAPSYRLLDQAFDAGINFFDTAEMYPVPQRSDTQGRSEEYIGRWIRDRNIYRNRIVLATKVSGPSGQMTWIRGGPKCLDSQNITDAIDHSLLRLRTDYIDLYQIHWPDRYVPMFGETEYDPTRQFDSIGIEEQLDALGKAITAGKVRYIGLSNETPYGVMKFVQAAESGSCRPRIVSVQNSYNLLCRNFDSGMAECCHHERIGLLAYSPLAMGILSGKYFSPDGGPVDARLNVFRGKYSEGESRYNLSKINIKAATMEYLDVAKKFGLHPISLAIAFLLRHPLITSVIFGATKTWQLQETINACKVELTSDVIAEINKTHAKFPNPCP